MIKPPRAKIGDVVVVHKDSVGKVQASITASSLIVDIWVHVVIDNERSVEAIGFHATDQDILLNLTTGVDYQGEEPKKIEL